MELWHLNKDYSAPGRNKIQRSVPNGTPKADRMFLDLDSGFSFSLSTQIPKAKRC